MKITKLKIHKLIIIYLLNETKKKKININFNLNKVDFIDKGIIDSLGFLTLISYLEKKLNTEIDLSDKNPDNLTKVDKLTNIICKKINK